MKRLWLGAGLLVFFLILGILLSVWMTNTHDHISRQLSLACTLSQSGDLAQAGRLAQDASSQWEQYRNRVAALADHTPMEEIDSLFCELQVYLQMDEPVHFSATCARLDLLLQAMGEAHSINWWTVL